MTGFVLIALSVCVGLLAAECEAYVRSYWWSGRTVEQWADRMGDGLVNGVRGAALWVIGVERL